MFIILRQSPKAFVEKLDFITSVGHLDGGDARERLGLPGRGPTKVITDLGVMTPDPTTRELTLTQLHPGRDGRAGSRPDGLAAEGRRSRCSTTEAPTAAELETLRALHRRTKLAHAQGSRGMIGSFAYDALPGRVVFGDGALSKLAAGSGRARPQARRRADDAAAGRARASTSPRSWVRARRAATAGRGCTCRSSVVDDAMATIAESDADCLLAIGGGSTTGPRQGARAPDEPADRRRADHLRRLGDDARSGGSRKAAPRPRDGTCAFCRGSSIYDADLLKTLPPDVVATSGMNAIAHCVEALYSADRQSRHFADGGRGRPGDRGGAAARGEDGNRQGGARAGPLRRLARRNCSRRRRHGAPSQALPHARRQFQPAARRGPHDRHSARDRLQRRGRAGGDGDGRARARRPSPRTRPARSST